MNRKLQAFQLIRLYDLRKKTKNKKTEIILIKRRRRCELYLYQSGWIIAMFIFEAGFLAIFGLETEVLATEKDAKTSKRRSGDGVVSSVWEELNL